MRILALADRAWRWIGTVFSFSLFGLVGILLPIFVVPLLRLLPGSQEQRNRRAQAVIHHLFRFFVGVMRHLGVLSYKLTGVEKLKDAELVLANHPTLIDVVFLIALMPNANCIVKGKLARNPFTSGPVRTAGYILNENNEDVIDLAKQAISKGDALIIFPEGTRTTPNQSLSLKRGAAHVAIRAGANITPVVIQCTPTTLTKEDRWYAVPSRRVHISIKVGNEIPIKQFIEGLSPSIGARKLTSQLTEYFTKELGQYE